MLTRLLRGGRAEERKRADVGYWPGAAEPVGMRPIIAGTLGPGGRPGRAFGARALGANPKHRCDHHGQRRTPPHRPPSLAEPR